MKKWIAILALVLPLPLVGIGFILGLMLWAIWNGIGLAQDFYATAYRSVAHDEFEEIESKVEKIQNELKEIENEIEEINEQAS